MTKKAKNIGNQSALDLTPEPSVGKEVAKRSRKRVLESAPGSSSDTNITKKVKKLTRAGADEYFLKIASVVAERSTCRRHHIGAIAVRDKHILSTGYNGAPSGFPDCLQLGCLRNDLNIPSAERPEICRGVHAEQNVIIQAALHGVSLEGSTIYATHTPCNQCAKMLVNARIKRYVSYHRYDDTTLRAFVNLSGFLDLFGQAGVSLDIVGRPPSEIEYLD